MFLSSNKIIKSKLGIWIHSSYALFRLYHPISTVNSFFFCDFVFINVIGYILVIQYILRNEMDSFNLPISNI